MDDLTSRLAKNLQDILRDALQMAPTEQVLVIFDAQSPLSRLMVDAYRQAVPTGKFVDFDTITAADVGQLFDGCKTGDLVVLAQSTNFRLDQFRIRIELFKRGLKAIEHTHLNRMPEEQFGTYIDALAYDANYYRPLGHALKTKLDRVQSAVVKCKGTELVYAGPMEETKLNIGDYTGMKNVGGTFPIGEVFTEPRDLRLVNGDARVFGFANTDFVVRTFDPFLVTIKDGILTSPDGPPEFQALLEKIREDEDVMVREFGLGLNPAMGKHRVVSDITAFERQRGLHFSLGAKHGIYAKPGLRRRDGRYHVDIFIDAEQIILDDHVIYQDGNFIP
ncbi:MAG: hypothetical protein WA001_01810 [Patescibacteria group bacterium]